MNDERQSVARADDPREATPKRPRGFAAMKKEDVIRIARLGGHASHAKGSAHRFTSTEAREAGRKGGRAPHVTRGRQRPSNGRPPAGDSA